MGSKVILIGLAMMAATVGLQAQVTSNKVIESAGPAKVTTEQLTGEVVAVLGNTLLARMQPGGELRVFDVQPGREFLIDGQTKHIGDLAPRTLLTATFVTTTQPLTARTMSSITGTVWHISGNYVILTHPNGENHGYKVADSFQFIVNGKPASVTELRTGMRVSATKIVEEPHTAIGMQTAITGKAPK